MRLVLAFAEHRGADPAAAEGERRATTLAGLRWLGDHGIQVKGHNLVWPGWRNLPKRIKALAGDAEPVEIAVVARMGAVLPLLAAELGDAVAAVIGPVPVDVTVTDVEAVPGAAVVGWPDAATAPVHPGRPQTGGLA